MTESIDITTVIQAVGGLGLFLLGMVVMTEGLRELAGDTLRRSLTRFTKSPVSGAATGAVSTALLQSSSATTVAAVGFVGAELMGFSNALGIIFGANIGTTITGWLVALLGFKLKLGEVMLPAIFIGAILRLFGQKKIAAFGHALAGFGLIFVGIATMQDAMAGLQDVVTPDTLPDDTLLGRLILVAIGMAMTVITQSSSAGVAAAITMVNAGAITFEQAAALVIGMDVGTTVTAAMATIGASTSARRTGLSHVIYNCFTGIGALVLITPFAMGLEAAAPGYIASNAEIALVAFHTTFNLLGVVLVLPMAGHFANLMERLVPEKMPAFARNLDVALLKHPPLALTAVQGIMVSQFEALLRHVNAMLGNITSGERVDLEELEENLSAAQHYLDRLQLTTGDGAALDRMVALIHALDHMQRLLERCEEEADRAETARSTEELMDECRELVESNELVLEHLAAQHWDAAAGKADAVQGRIHREVEPYRSEVIAQIAADSVDVPEGKDSLEAIRWLRRVSKHIARVTHHLGEAFSAAGRTV